MLHSERDRCTWGLCAEADLAMARDTGPGFSELLKPDVVEPLLENLHLEERLAPYLPEVVLIPQPSVAFPGQSMLQCQVFIKSALYINL